MGVVAETSVEFPDELLHCSSFVCLSPLNAASSKGYTVRFYETLSSVLTAGLAVRCADLPDLLQKSRLAKLLSSSNFSGNDKGLNHASSQES
jgi:hypothetical protein